MPWPKYARPAQEDSGEVTGSYCLISNIPKEEIFLLIFHNCLLTYYCSFNLQEYLVYLILDGRSHEHPFGRR